MSHDPADPSAQTRLFTRAFVALSVAELAYFTAAGIMIPTTPIYAEGPLSANEAGVGIVIGAFSVTALMLRPFAGREADRRGRRPLLIWGAFLCAIATALHLVATDLAILVGLRLLLGVAEAFFFVAGFAMVADLAPAGRAGEALSYNSLALYLGIALGPGIGEWLVSVGDFALAWVGAALLSLAAGVIAIGMRESTTPVADPVRCACSTDGRCCPRSACSPGWSGWPASSRSWRSGRAISGWLAAGPYSCCSAPS